MNPWAIYLRVSTDDQAREGISLEAQRSSCDCLARANGYPVGHVLEDAGISAMDKRPAYDRLRHLIATRAISGVIVFKLDRVERSTRRLLELVDQMQEAGIIFVSVQDKIDTAGAAGRFFLTVLAALAQFEREQLIERVKGANDHLRSQGAWVAGKPHAGLTLERRDRKRYLVADPTWGAVVAEGWRMAAAGKTLRNIADFWTAKRLPTKRGTWSTTAASYLLGRTCGIGIIIDQATWDQARATLGAKGNPRNRKGTSGKPSTRTERLWLLQGLGRCAKCGGSLMGTATSGKMANGYHPYLRCCNKAKHACDAPDLPAVAWEQAALTAVQRYLSSADFPAQVAAQVAAMQTKAGPAREKFRDLEMARDRERQRLDEAMSMALEGGPMARAVRPRIAALQATIESLEMDLARLQGQLSATDIAALNLEALVASYHAKAAGLLEEEPHQQAIALRHLVQEVHLARGMPMRIMMKLDGNSRNPGNDGESGDGDTPKNPLHPPEGDGAGSYGSHILVRMPGGGSAWAGIPSKRDYRERTGRTIG